MEAFDWNEEPAGSQENQASKYLIHSRPSVVVEAVEMQMKS